ncbi:MAG: hypothetical protein KatS3mg118_0422 [Paracoccaceae bacterium]|nr:MAG: hypothetical protein KatS3mg118_0422 [Paracoccaceae bacterium]
MASSEQRGPEGFDRDFYLAEYPEVAATGMDPEEHFNRIGWREGKDPSPYFSTEFYLETYPDIREAGINPFAHYLAHGRAEGRVTALSRSLRSRLSLRLDAMLAAEAAPAPDPAPEGGDPAALLFDSRFFHAGFYAARTGLSGGRAALIADYLSRPVAERPSPHPDFDPAFYRDTYLGGDDGIDPLIHYITEGRRRNRYASRLAVARDMSLLVRRSGFDRRVYARSLPVAPRFDDPVEDYLLHGQEHGAVPVTGFDGGFVDRVHMRPRDAACAPYAYYVRNMARPWIFSGIAELCPVYEAVARSPLFDPAFYAHVAGIDPAVIDAALHYVLRGVALGLPTSPDFHTGHYLLRNPDLRGARINPLLHFERHGRAEGRVAVPGARVPPPARAITPGRAARREGARSVIVVSHEASRTGAPIVALNLARILSQSHDVIVWLGRDGPLGEDFRAVASEVVLGIPPARDARELVRRLAQRHDIAFALVNSALSGVALDPLALEGIPAVLLVHDFATYVYPRGSLSRLVLNAQLAVFPARVVADAVAEETGLLGAASPPANIRIAHQGWNGIDHSADAVLTPESILARIGVTDRAAVRILFGCGWVQPRKGVDLFVQAAARLARESAHDWRFIWVGGNYRPEEDMLLSAFLADHVARAGLTGRMFFFDEQPDLEAFWSLTDVFFLSSRLDPYPNVALDALMRDIPVVCFAGATGIAELEPEFGFAVRAVPYCDVAAAAQAIDALAADPGLAAAFDAAREALSREMSMETYVARLVALGEEAAERMAATRALAARLAGRPLPELLAAAAAIPAWARLVATPEREPLALTIAALGESGGPLPPLAIAAEGGPVELAPDPDPLVRLCPPLPGSPPEPGDWMVHLHLPEGRGAQALPDLGTLTRHARVVVTTPRGARAGIDLPRRVLLHPAPAPDALAGLRAVLADNAAPWITHLDLGTVPGDLVGLLIDEELAGAAIAEAARGGRFAVAIPGRGAELRPRRAVEAHAGAGGAPVARRIAPAFAGLHERAALADFIESGGLPGPAVRVRLNPLELAALVALRHGAWCGAQGLATLILPDPEAGLIETQVIDERVGIPEEPPRLPAEAILAPLTAPPAAASPAPAAGTGRAGRSVFGRLLSGIARSRRRS